MTDLQQAIWSIAERSWKVMVEHRHGNETLELDDDFTLGRTWTELRQDGHKYRVIVEAQLPEDGQNCISVPHHLSMTLDGERVIFFECNRIVDFAAKHWKEDVLFGPMVKQMAGPWMQTIDHIDKRLRAHEGWLKTEDTGHVRN
jgi:hypothetical protein